MLSNFMAVPAGGEAMTMTKTMSNEARLAFESATMNMIKAKCT
jgi:hypothetical protein